MPFRLGLVQLGKFSTQFYLDELYRQNKLLGVDHVLEINTVKTNFEQINQHLPKNFEQLIPLLKRHTEHLKTLDLDATLFPNISLHETLDKMDHGLELIHPIKVTLDSLYEKRIKKIAIWGTKYIARDPFFFDLLKKINVECITLSDQMIDSLDAMRKAVYKNGIDSKLLLAMQEMINAHIGEAPILIACTELSALNAQLPPTKNVIDMAKLQIEKVIDHTIIPT